MVVLVYARMRKIQSKIKALEWSQDYSLIFQSLKGSLSVVGSGILTKFKVIQAFMVVYGDFSKRSGAAYSSVPGPILLNFEPFSRFYVCPRYLQE